MSGPVMFRTPSDSPAAIKLLKSVAKRWMVVVLFIVIGAAVALGDIAATAKSYTASVQIFVAAATPTSASSDSLNAGNIFTQARVQSYIDVADSTTVADGVRQQLNLSISDRAIQGKLSATAPLNKVLITIHANDASPQLATQIANAAGEQFIKTVESIEAVPATAKAEPTSPVKLTVIRPASLPHSPVTPRKTLILLTGLLGGAVLGLLFVIGWDRLDTRVRTAGDVTVGDGPPVLANIPTDKRTLVAPFAIRDDTAGARSEAFRQLRTNLQFVNADKPPRVIAVASAGNGEGKTVVALNLAATLAEAGLKVCLVEADLREPSLAGKLGLSAQPGLSSLLIGQGELATTLQDAGGGLSVLTSGPKPPNPSDLLASEHLKAIVVQLAERNDFVILDTAPLLTVADGLEVASIADATLLIVRSGRTKRQALIDAVQSVRRVEGSLAGVVVNGV